MRELGESGEVREELSGDVAAGEVDFTHAVRRVVARDPRPRARVAVAVPFCVFAAIFGDGVLGFEECLKLEKGFSVCL